MFLIHLIRMTLALPFIWMGQALLMVQVSQAVQLLKAGWVISGDGMTGVKYLGAVHRFQGLGAANRAARQAVALRPAPGLAAYAGLLARDIGDIDGMRRNLELAKSFEPDPAGLVDTLEFLLLTANESDPVAGEHVLRRYAKRTDLPPMVSKMACEGLLWKEMVAQNFGEARQIAQRMLQIEESFLAEMTMWALATRDGNELLAQKHLQAGLVAPQSTESYRLYVQALCYSIIGQPQRGHAMIEQLEQVDPPAAASLRDALGDKKEASTC